MELPPDMPPPLAAGWDAELQVLVHEDERECSAIRAGRRLTP